MADSSVGQVSERRKWSDGRVPALLPWNAPATRAPAGRFEELDDEIARARRYRQHLSIAVLGVHPSTPTSSPSTGPRLRGSRLPPVVALAAAVGLREVLRATDVICYDARGRRFVLALAQSDADGARVALGRVRDHLAASWRLRIQAGVSQLLGDAVTLDGLIRVAASSAVDVGDEHDGAA